ncbi:MAG: conserved rane protein of unknown function [Blastococcus sp.]|jgi:hypothetical protein|nr:conserved rane protein of unknown function [Blastococcus sp.]
MATAHTADAWQPGGGRPERSFATPRPPRPERMGSDRMAERRRSDHPGLDRGTSDRMGADRTSRDRMPPERPSRPVRTSAPPVRGAAAGHNAGYAAAGRGAGYPRVSQGGRPLDPRGVDGGTGRSLDPGVDRGVDRDRAEERRPAARRSETARPRSQAAAPEAGGRRLRGTLAVIGLFLITLAGAGADSFFGIGLGMITLVCLVAGTVFAALLVRRRDLISVVVAPPLVFVAVAAVNIGLAPSAHFNLPTVATLLVRGFPTMAVATGVAIVLALFRLVARR